MSMSDFVIRVILASQNKLRSIISSPILRKSLFKVCVISYMFDIIHQWNHLDLELISSFLGQFHTFNY